jgi:hypothetical protein
MRWQYGMLAVGTLSMLPECILWSNPRQVEVEHYSIAMLWLLFHSQIPVTWNAKLPYDICPDPGWRIGPCICCFMFSLWFVKPCSIISVSVCALNHAWLRWLELQCHLNWLLFNS